MGRVLAIANQKGGVGKTTTAVNLSAYLAAAGKRTLIIDMDPQGNATQGMGVDKDSSPNAYHVVMGEASIDEAARDSEYEHLRVLPANRDLVGAEVELVDADRREFRLRRALEQDRDRYDYIFIDCPPSLGLLTLNGLVAADGLIITLQCEYYALEGLSELLRTVVLVRGRLNPALRVHGVLLTMYQQTNLSRQVRDDVCEHLGEKVFETVIPRNVTLGEAPSYGQPVRYYDPTCKGALAYDDLSREVMARG